MLKNKDKMKEFYTRDNIGKAKYAISYHDGESLNKDGSKFWGIRIFKNKRKYNATIKEMIKEGYKLV